MRKLNKKGFTLVELVIVVAVIAILSAVLIPTVSGLISSSKDAATLSAARNAYTEYVANAAQNGEDAAEDFVYYSVSNGRYVCIIGGNLDETTLKEASNFDKVRTEEVPVVFEIDTETYDYVVAEASSSIEGLYKVTSTPKA